MCGRYVSATKAQALAELFGAAFEGEELSPSYNVAPTNDVYAVVGTPDSGQPRIEVFHWGLVPVWAKDISVGNRMINARAETLAEKPAFKSLFAKHRCIVPMDGFYEWKTPGPAPTLYADAPDAAEPTLFTDAQAPDARATEARRAPTGKRAPKAAKPPKQPMFIHRADGKPLAVAGLWTTWRDKAAGPDAPWLHSLTVVTTGANVLMSGVHDRMPVVLSPEDWAQWLDPENRDTAALQHLLRPADEDVLVMHPVSTEVNNARNKGSHLIDPLPTA